MIYCVSLSLVMRLSFGCSFHIVIHLLWTTGHEANNVIYNSWGQADFFTILNDNDNDSSIFYLTSTLKKNHFTTFREKMQIVSGFCCRY